MDDFDIKIVDPQRLFYRMHDGQFTTKFHGRDEEHLKRRVEKLEAVKMSMQEIEKADKIGDRSRFDIIASLLPELRDMIFEKLYDSETYFLDYSLVSKTWNKMLGNSKVFRNNYFFSYDQHQLWSDELSRIESYDFFQNTEKCYDSFKLSHKPMDAMLDCFPSTNWKTGSIEDVTFNNVAQFEKFLHVIAATIECFSLEEVTIGNCVTTNEGPTIELIFQNMSVLTIITVSNDVINPFLKFHPQLKVVEFRNLVPNPMSIEIFTFNPQIRALKINEEIYSLASVFQVNFCKLKLKSLEIHIEITWSKDQLTNFHSKEMREKLKHFLISQGSSLETLICFNVPEMPALILEIWKDIKHLKKLCIDNFPYQIPLTFTNKEPQLCLNLNLIELSIVVGTIQPDISYYEEIFKNAPNLKSLNLCKINKEIIFLVARKLKYLKHLKYNEKETHSLVSYEQLKTSMLRINKEIVFEKAYY